MQPASSPETPEAQGVERGESFRFVNFHAGQTLDPPVAKGFFATPRKHPGPLDASTSSGGTPETPELPRGMERDRDVFRFVNFHTSQSLGPPAAAKGLFATPTKLPGALDASTSSGGTQGTRSTTDRRLLDRSDSFGSLGSLSSLHASPERRRGDDEGVDHRLVGIRQLQTAAERHGSCPPCTPKREGDREAHDGEGLSTQERELLDTLQIPSCLIGTAAEQDSAEDLFAMYVFKVFKCTRVAIHDWKECPFCHEGETATRRDPKCHIAEACVCFRQKKFCPRGEACSYAHGPWESGL